MEDVAKWNEGITEPEYAQPCRVVVACADSVEDVKSSAHRTLKHTLRTTTMIATVALVKSRAMQRMMGMSTRRTSIMDGAFGLAGTLLIATTRMELGPRERLVKKMNTGVLMTRILWVRSWSGVKLRLFWFIH